MTTLLSCDEFKTDRYTFSYDTNKYDLETPLRKIFDNWTDPINQLYKFFENSETLDQITIDNDTKTKFHNKWYSSPHYDEFLNVYYSLVREVICPLFKDESAFIVQKDPAFRIHLPNNTALGFRPNMGDPDDKIGIHCDSDYNHPDPEINFMLTLSGQKDNNSCFVETAPGSDVFQPLNMEYGQFTSFYGNKCRHYNKTNDTGVARISIDFRIFPKSKYNPNYEKASIHGKRPFLVGGYYVEIVI